MEALTVFSLTQNVEEKLVARANRFPKFLGMRTYWLCIAVSSR